MVGEEGMAMSGVNHHVLDASRHSTKVPWIAPWMCTAENGMHAAMHPAVEDLAPGDAKSAGLDPGSFTFHRIRSEADKWFEPAYERLWAEFGEKNEMERRATLAARFALAPEMIYEMILVQKDGHFAAVRDHTAIPADGEVVVHLSHKLVAPEYRRTGLTGWMRALPLATAREFQSGAPVTLAAEMEF